MDNFTNHSVEGLIGGEVDSGREKESLAKGTEGLSSTPSLGGEEIEEGEEIVEEEEEQEKILGEGGVVEIDLNCTCLLEAYSKKLRELKLDPRFLCVRKKGAREKKRTMQGPDDANIGYEIRITKFH